MNRGGHNRKESNTAHNVNGFNSYRTHTERAVVAAMPRIYLFSELQKRWVFARNCLHFVMVSRVGRVPVAIKFISAHQAQTKKKTMHGIQKTRKSLTVTHNSQLHNIVE